MIESIPFIQDYGLFGILILTAISYSVIPFPSEAAIVIASNFLSPYAVIAFALVGSTIGAISSYCLGYFGLRNWSKKLAKSSKMEMKARKIFEKHGNLSIFLFSWLPFVGDPLIILAGSFEMNFLRFLIYSTSSRIIYFTLVVLGGLGIEDLFGINLF